jgi:hypothetical protein
LGLQRIQQYRHRAKTLLQAVDVARLHLTIGRLQLKRQQLQIGRIAAACVQRAIMPPQAGGMGLRRAGCWNFAR